VEESREMRQGRSHYPQRPGLQDRKGQRVNQRQAPRHEEDGYSVGFPGKQVGAAAVLEAGKVGQANDKFQLG